VYFSSDPVLSKSIKEDGWERAGKFGSELFGNIGMLFFVSFIKNI